MDEESSSSGFLTQADYRVALLEILAGLTDGTARTRDVVARFEERYGDRIAPDHRAPRHENTTIPVWKDMLHQARLNLVRRHLMDSPADGIWQITEQGRQWLAADPKPAVRRTTRRATAPPVSSQHTVTLPMLEQVRKYLPEAEFRRVWGDLYEQLLAEERARSITAINRKALTDIVMSQVQRIHDLLQGRGGNRPSDEQLCDWVHFAYQLGLHREASALLPLISAAEVNDWYYERTKRIALASGARVGR
jgi:restriction endonuclease Mrr